MAEEDVEVVRRLLLAYSRGDFPTMLDLIHAEIRVHPRPEEPGVEDVYEGHDGLFAYAGNWMSQWDDYEIEPVSFRPVAASRVLVEMAERGHLKRTGITIDERFSHSFTVVGGKVTEWRMYDSHEQALETLGLAS